MPRCAMLSRRRAGVSSSALCEKSMKLRTLAIVLSCIVAGLPVRALALSGLRLANDGL